MPTEIDDDGTEWKTERFMTHTIRIYNRRLKKAQRYDLHKSGYDNNEVSINHVGIPFTWRSYLCMGNCHMCKDHTKDQRFLRKKRSEQFRFDLKNEMT